ncbi:MAG: hypothetical protein ACYC63_07200 [Armatimonadota bacterium]
MSVASIIIMVAVMLAWIVPLIVGLRLLRGGQRASGLVLTIIGALWAIPSLIGMVVAGMYWSALRSDFETKDFKPAEYRGVTGVVQTPYRGSCTLTTQHGRAQERVRYVTGNGSFILPVGTHRVDDFVATAQSPAGGKWEGQSRVTSRNSIEVKRDAPQELRVGPPYVAQISVSERSGKVYMSLQCKDVGGYDAIVQQTARAATAPGFLVANKAGKTLFSGKFAFG